MYRVCTHPCRILPNFQDKLTLPLLWSQDLGCIPHSNEIVFASILFTLVSIVTPGLSSCRELWDTAMSDVKYGVPLYIPSSIPTDAPSANCTTLSGVYPCCRASSLTPPHLKGNLSVRTITSGGARPKHAPAACICHLP